MANATTYGDWAVACSKVEKLQGLDGPNGMGRWERETRLYDRKLLEERAKHLQVVKLDGDVHEMMFAVRADLLRNLGNMCNRYGSAGPCNCPCDAANPTLSPIRPSHLSCGLCT